MEQKIQYYYINLPLIYGKGQYNPNQIVEIELNLKVMLKYKIPNVTKTPLGNNRKIKH